MKIRNFPTLLEIVFNLDSSRISVSVLVLFAREIHRRDTSVVWTLFSYRNASTPEKPTLREKIYLQRALRRRATALPRAAGVFCICAKISTSLSIRGEACPPVTRGGVNFLFILFFADYSGRVIQMNEGGARTAWRIVTIHLYILIYNNNTVFRPWKSFPLHIARRCHACGPLAPLGRLDAVLIPGS